MVCLHKLPDLIKRDVAVRADHFCKLQPIIKLAEVKAFSIEISDIEQKPPFLFVPPTFIFGVQRSRGLSIAGSACRLLQCTGSRCQWRCNCRAGCRSDWWRHGEP